MHIFNKKAIFKLFKIFFLIQCSDSNCGQYSDTPINQIGVNKFESIDTITFSKDTF